MPERIRLSRRKGWRKPEGAVVVARPSRWGNPFTAADAIKHGYANSEAEGREVAAGAFRDWLHGDSWAAGSGPEWEDRRFGFLESLRDLAGRDLACWCPLDEPCHADVLLEIANAA